MKFTQFLLSFLFVSSLADGNRANPKNKDKQRAPPPKATKFNEALLPDLLVLLEELGLKEYTPRIIRMGVTETHQLLRLTDMDFRIMNFEIGIPQPQINELRRRIAELYIIAKVEDIAVPLEYKEREKLNYGRVYVPNGVQTFEYMSASFGGPPPIGPRQSVIGRPVNGCTINESVGDLTNKVYIVLRGECPFLLKAKVAKARNATALIIVNNEDRLESLSSGFGIIKGIMESDVVALNGLAVISVSNTSWAKLDFSSKFAMNNSLPLSIIPLSCLAGGKCIPIIKEEKSVFMDNPSGVLTIKNSLGESQMFDFLTSNFGGTLPAENEEFNIFMADPIDGCVPENELTSELRHTFPFANVSSASLAAQVRVTVGTDGILSSSKEQAGYESKMARPYEGAAVLMHRGKCSFGHKALVAQAGGARLLIITDPDGDGALQRLGGQLPAAGYAAIPSVYTTLPAGEFIESHLRRTGGGDTDKMASVSASVTTVHRDDRVSEAWIDVAHTEWLNEDTDAYVAQLEGMLQRHKQAGNQDIIAWLQRRLASVRSTPVRG